MNHFQGFSGIAGAGDEDEEEPYYCSPACGPDDILCPGSDAEDTPDQLRKRRLRYEAAAQTIAGGRMPTVLSATLKGPFSKGEGWINPWRHRPKKKKKHEEWWQPGSEDMLFTRANVMKRAAAHGLGYLSPAEALQWCKDTAKAEARSVQETGLESGAVMMSVERDEMEGEDEGEGEEGNLPSDDGYKSPTQQTIHSKFSRNELSMLNHVSRTPLADGTLRTSTKFTKRPAESQWLKGSYVSKRTRWEGSAVDSPTPLPDVLKSHRRRRLLSMKAPGLGLGGAPAIYPSRYSAQGTQKTQSAKGRTWYQGTNFGTPSGQNNLATCGSQNRSSQPDSDGQQDDIQEGSEESEFGFITQGSSIDAEQAPKKAEDRSSDLKSDDLRAETPLTKQTSVTQLNSLQKSLERTHDSTIHELPPLIHNRPLDEIGRFEHEDDDSFVTEVAPSSRNLEKFHFRRRARSTQPPIHQMATRVFMDGVGKDSARQTHEEQNVFSEEMGFMESPIEMTISQSQNQPGVAKVPVALRNSESQTTPPHSDKSGSWDKIETGNASSFLQAAESSPQSPPRSNASATDTPSPSQKKAHQSLSLTAEHDVLSTPLQDRAIAMDYILGLPEIPAASPWKMPGFDDFGLPQEFQMSPKGSPKPSPRKSREGSRRIRKSAQKAWPSPSVGSPQRLSTKPPKFHSIAQLAESSQKVYDSSTQSYNTTPSRSLPAPNQSVKSSLVQPAAEGRENISESGGKSTNDIARIQTELSQVYPSSSHRGSPHSIQMQTSQNLPHEDRVLTHQPSRPQSEPLQDSLSMGFVGSTLQEQSAVEFDAHGLAIEAEAVTPRKALFPVQGDGQLPNSSFISGSARASKNTLATPGVASKENVEITDTNVHLQVEPEAIAVPKILLEVAAEGQEDNESSSEAVHPAHDAIDHDNESFAGVDFEATSDINGCGSKPVFEDSPYSETSWEGCGPQSPWAMENLEALPTYATEQRLVEMAHETPEGSSRGAGYIATSDHEISLDASCWEPSERPLTPELVADPANEKASVTTPSRELTDRHRALDDSGITPFESFESPTRSPNVSITSPGNDLMDTQSFGESGLNNPWASATKSTSTAKLKKRVSFGYLEEVEDDSNDYEVARSSMRQSPPPRIGQDDDEDIFHDGTMVTNTFRKHFVTVTRPRVFKRILPETQASQPTSSPTLDAQAEAFVAADCHSSTKPSWSPTSKPASPRQLKPRSDSNSNTTWNVGEEEDPMLMNPFIMTPKVRNTSAAPTFDMDEVLGAAADFLGDWSVDAELKKAKEPPMELQARARERDVSTCTGYRRRKLFGLV